MIWTHVILIAVESPPLKIVYIEIREKFINKIYVNCALQLIFIQHTQMFQSIPYFFSVCLTFFLTSTFFFLTNFRLAFLSSLSSFLFSSFLLSSNPLYILSFQNLFISCSFLSCFFLSSFFRSSYLFLVLSILLFSSFFLSVFNLFTTTLLPKETVSRGRYFFEVLKINEQFWYERWYFKIQHFITSMLTETLLNPSSVNSRCFQVPFPYTMQCKCPTFAYHTGLLNDFSGWKLPTRISEEGPKNFYLDFAQ